MYDPPHPGEVIRELCLNGMERGEAAKRLGVPEPELRQLLEGRAGISPRMALKLEAAGWSNADYWMRLQSGHDLDQERQRQAAA